MGEAEAKAMLADVLSEKLERRTEALQTALSQVEALRTALEDAVSDILDLAHARWSEVEATDDQLVGHYRAALASSTPESSDHVADAGKMVALARVIHAAHKSAPYPWWHLDAEHCQVSPHIARAVIAHLAPAERSGQAEVQAEVEVLRERLEISEGLLKHADEVVEVLTRSRRPHGYVISTCLPLDRVLNDYLSSRELAAIVTPAEARSAND